MPELIWARLDSNSVVDSMINIMQKYKPQFWWSEAGAIGKSIGPFLRKRMAERKVYCAIDPIAPAVDKQQRAQSIQARSAMKMVHFPGWTPWWGPAQDQLLKFPNAPKDDFVDTLALVGLGLSKMRSRNRQKEEKPEIRPGTFGALWAQTKHRESSDRVSKELDGWL